MAAREELIQAANAQLKAAPTSNPLAATVRALLQLIESTNTAAQTTYTPAVPADWNNDPPTTIAGALDRVAALVGPVT